MGDGSWAGGGTATLLSTPINVAGEGRAPQTTRMAGCRHKTPEKKRKVTLAWAPEKLRRRCTADCRRRTRRDAKMEWLMPLIIL